MDKKKSLGVRLEKVEFINNKNIDLAHKGFTGSVIVHWYQGEPQKIEVTTKKDLK